MYTIYSNIDYNQYVVLSAKMEELETSVKEYFNHLNYSIENPISKSDALIIDAISNNGNSYSNVSIQFDDKDHGEPTFSVYALKTIDLENKRFFVKLTIAEAIEVEILQHQIFAFLDKAITSLKKISDEEILQGECIEMPPL